MKDTLKIESVAAVVESDLQPLSVQCFEHRGEAVIAFSQHVQQWFLSPANARKFGEAILQIAQRLEAQAATRQ